jgi:ubiquinone/menaquinone biosynthesis C-methylase UbiE
MSQHQCAAESLPNDSIRFNYHTTKDSFIRYIRDRRLSRGLSFLKKYYGDQIFSWKVLVICGGTGGDGIFFLNAGFTDVSVSDISANYLEIAKTLDSRLKRVILDAENLPLSNNSFDLVVVQDGLHHLPRPTLGFTEMLRVSKHDIIVIEPYDSLVGNIFGTKWEKQEEIINFVFRWNRSLVEQTVKSYLLHKCSVIKVFRFWDHNLMAQKIMTPLPKKLQLSGAKMIYFLLSLINFSGNMMVSVVCKSAKKYIKNM